MTRRKAQTEAAPPCYAMTFPGLESVAEEEIKKDLGGEIRKSTEGIVVFRVPEIDAALLQLRTTEDVYLFAWGTDSLTYRAKDLETIRHWTAREVNWTKLLKYHHAIRPKPQGRPTYRIITQMAGEHGYLRTGARTAFTEGLAGKFPASWHHAEENAAVEFWLTITGKTAVCGLRLTDKTMRHRTYKLEHLKASLRPTMAAAMVRVAEIKTGHVVLDPMCGAGTILAETWEGCRHWKIRPLSVWGGDIERAAIRAAGPNLRNIGRVNMARWDARTLPMAENSVDRIICNPPFGKQMSRPEDIGPLYKLALREWNRVLRPRGKAVLLVSDFGALKDAASAVNWKREQQLRVRVLGQPAYITVWRKDPVV